MWTDVVGLLANVIGRGHKDLVRLNIYGCTGGTIYRGGECRGLLTGLECNRGLIVTRALLVDILIVLRDMRSLPNTQSRIPHAFSIHVGMLTLGIMK